MVGPFYFALKSRLAGIAGRNKLLMNMKAHLQRCAFCFAFIWFRVQGSGFRALVAASPQVLYKAMPEGLLIADLSRIVSPLAGKVPRRGG